MAVRTGSQAITWVLAILAVLVLVPLLAMLGMMTMGGMMGGSMGGHMGSMDGMTRMHGWGLLVLTLLTVVLIAGIVVAIRALRRSAGE